jgi:hypothetical protein
MVIKVKVSLTSPPLHFASLFRGLYGRIARQLDIDPSYVSRVARGERQSESIEAALEREMKKIIAFAKTNHNGAGRNGLHSANHDGANHHRSKKKSASKKFSKKT